jgi:hypothetical protein
VRKSRKYSKQQCIKLIDKECLFCGEKEYKLLDCHRIYPGEKGGTYVQRNTITSCANCHRKMHGGLIRVVGKYLGSDGRWVVIYFDENNVEHLK